MIYCNMVKCNWRDELEEPHERDSMIPVEYTGTCRLGAIKLNRMDFLSAGRNRNLVAVCDDFTEENVKGTLHDDILCGLNECASNEDGVCDNANRSRHKDIYITPSKIFYNNTEGIFPVCTSKSRTLKDLGRKDWSQYPKR